LWFQRDSRGPDCLSTIQFLQGAMGVCIRRASLLDRSLCSEITHLALQWSRNNSAMDPTITALSDALLTYP
jgi:hypothetical protein